MGGLWTCDPAEHVEVSDRERDLWQVTYIDAPSWWSGHVRIYREREAGESWAAIGARHLCSVAAAKGRHRVVAEHLEYLAETGGELSALTVVSRCPGVPKRVRTALEGWGIRTLGEFERELAQQERERRAQARERTARENARQLSRRRLAERRYDREREDWRQETITKATDRETVLLLKVRLLGGLSVALTLALLVAIGCLYIWK